uniref:Uncharacterized protein n=1 Tax=Echinococcus canadensis TaxID=519352 RepID=A0A915EY59_9CEST
MVLNEAAEDVSKTAIVSIAFILIGVMLVVARRRSYSLILYIILITILLICSSLLFIVLNVLTYSPLGSVNSLYKLLMCYNKSVYGIRDSKIGFDVDMLNDNLINFLRKFTHLDCLLIIIVCQMWRLLPICEQAMTVTDLLPFQDRLVRVLFDQTLWETSINLPPNHGVLGLLLASIMASCIPFALSVVCGLVIFAIPTPAEQNRHPHHFYCASPAPRDLVHVQHRRRFINPVSRCPHDVHSILQEAGRPGNMSTLWQVTWSSCESTIKEECSSRPGTTLVYGCQTHGAYRAYTDEMSKRVLHISFTVLAGMIPIFIIFSKMTVVNFIYFGLCTPFVGCFCLSILWARLSRASLLIGYFVSAGASLILRFALDNATSLVLHDLWGNFCFITFILCLRPQQQQQPETKQIRLIGMTVALLGGFLLPALLTLLLTKPLSPKVARRIWSCVQEIDNPLVPWPEVYT